MDQYEFLATALLQKRDKGGLLVECYKRGMAGAFRLLVSNGHGEERREKLHSLALKKKDIKTMVFLVGQCVFPTGAVLIRAARAGNLEAVRLCLDCDQDLPSLEDALEDACIAASDVGVGPADACADAIERKRIQVYKDRRDVDHERSLMRACRNCDLVAVKGLLEYTSFADLERAVAEVCLCSKGCSQAGAIISLLHEQGANLRYTNGEGATLLSLCHNAQSAEALLALGCRATARDVATVFDNRLIPHEARARMLRALTG